MQRNWTGVSDITWNESAQLGSLLMLRDPDIFLEMSGNRIL